jgi:hypothetical protein
MLGMDAALGGFFVLEKDQNTCAPLTLAYRVCPTSFPLSAIALAD